MPWTEWGIDQSWEAKVKTFLELGMDYAQAKTDVMNLENIKKTIIAEQSKLSHASSQGGRDNDAYTSEPYRQWCREYAEASRRSEGLRLRLEALRIWFEMARTHAATKRAEMSFQ